MSEDSEVYYGFITVRTASTRLPNKCLLPFGQHSVIGHVITRSLNYGLRPIVCTSTDPSDDVLEKIAIEHSIPVFRGSLKNKLQRWLDCANHFGIESFHTIDADDPFFDGEEMIRSMQLLKNEACDVVTPTDFSSNGGASVGYSLTKSIISKALSGVALDEDTEMMWYYLEDVSGIDMRNLSELQKTTSSMRLTLDYEEDYWLLLSIVRILGNDCQREDINSLFKRNPDLYKINYFRNNEWKSAQLSKGKNSG